MSKVTMVMGYPGSGKSTLTKELIANGAISLNRDTEGGTIVSLLPKMDSLLNDKKSIVLDNLFPTAEIRKPFLDMAKQHGVDIECKLMGTSIEDATFNVIQRAIELTGKFPTPEVIKAVKHTNIFPPLVLFRYKKEFQKPDVSEGFSKIETIKFVRKDNPTFNNKALITDYDGCVRNCINGNGKYPTSISHVEINKKAIDILLDFKSKGYFILGVSNQSGVSKKEMTYEQASEIFDFTNKQLGIDIDYRFCPHQSAPISCYCRKPMNGFGVEFILKYKLDRKQCIFVGDMTTDRTFASRCGFQYIDQADIYK